jgi:ribose-phosphate pyrophosphokinase
VDTLNHDSSISILLSPVERIQQRVKEYNETHYGK